jgi:1,3-beta-glucanosyltransferase GAS3
MSLFSGGLVYEYSQETDDYGIVAINSSTEVELLSDYSTLEERFAGINLNAIMSANPSATAVSAKECASVTVSNTKYFPTNFDIPAAPSGIDSIISGGLTSASWWSAGALTTVTATTMPATIMNYTGASVQSDNMHLVQYACDQINAPGKAATYSFPASTPSCAYSTSRPTGTSGSSSHKNGASARLSFEMGPIVLLAVSFFFGVASFAL